jgi:hypothetical protein
MDVLRVGDVVEWRGAWGTQPPQIARVETIDQTQARNQKYGDPVEEFRWDSHFVVGLDNGFWAYGYQLSPVVGGK